MAVKHGNLSINSENIFPIIKKWLYSDHDIFVRELVSNGCDAITKLKKLEVMGEYTFPEGYKPEIQVIVNPDEKTLKFIDNGIGMTADEVEKYITQIAFSGATQFLEKYKDKTTDDQMIGHFGLGFYSAFMVADEVHIDTLSYTEGAQPVHWSCDGGTEYDIQEGNKNTIGTEITLFLNEDCLEFANEYRMREILEKYCSFMELAKALHGLNRSGEDSLVQSVLGYRDSQMFLKDEFEAYGPVYAATEDGSFGTSGNVLDAIREQGLTADVIYACGPTPMLRALKAYAAEKGLECWLSLEEKMACGVGACLACVCRSKEVDGHSQVHNKRICKDGPVFRSDEIEL